MKEELRLNRKEFRVWHLIDFEFSKQKGEGKQRKTRREVVSELLEFKKIDSSFTY